MARRTLLEYKASVVHALGGDPSVGLGGQATAALGKLEIVNDALINLCSLYPWRWRRGGPVGLSFSTSATTATATWTEATKTLTQAAAFASYTFRPGDVYDVVSGTGATAGRFNIVSQTSANAIVLSASIAAAGTNLTTADITGNLFSPHIPLPTDFGEEYEITYPGTFARDVVRTTMAEIQWMRASQINPASNLIYYAINSGEDGSASTGLGRNQLEIYPAPAEVTTNLLTLSYLRDVPRLTGDTDIPRIPYWMDFALDLLVRSFAMIQQDDNADNPAQMAFDRMLATLKQRDANTQSRLGVMQSQLSNGATRGDVFYPTRIGDPTQV